MKNVKKLLGLYWAEKKNVVFFFWLGVFLFYVFLSSVPFYGQEYHHIRIKLDFYLLGLLFILYQRKSILIPTDKKETIMLSVKPIEKWIVQFLVGYILVFVLSFVGKNLGEITGVNLIRLLRYGDKIEYGFWFAQKDVLLFNATIFFFLQSLFCFISMAATPRIKTWTNMKAVDYLLIIFTFLVYWVVFQSFGIKITDNMYSKIVINITLTLLFLVVNYYLIKRKELK